MLKSFLEVFEVVQPTVCYAGPVSKDPRGQSVGIAAIQCGVDMTETLLE